MVQTTRIVAGRQTLEVTKGRDVTSPNRFGIFANLCNRRSRGTARSLNTAKMQALVVHGLTKESLSEACTVEMQRLCHDKWHAHTHTHTCRPVILT